MSQPRANYYRNIPQTSFQRRPARCYALRKNGSDCTSVLQAPHHDFCFPHYSEKQRLYRQYKEEEAKLSTLGDPTDKRSLETLEEMAQVGKRTIALRDEVNHRFFSQGTGNNRGHIKRILMVKSKVDLIDALIASKKRESPSGGCNGGISSTITEGETEGQVMVYQSLLSPAVPMSKLDHLARDSHIVVLRTAMDHIRAAQVDKIYKMLPSLDDSSTLVHDKDDGKEREPDKGDHVLRNVFREYLVWTGDTDVLMIASKIETIDSFLRHSTKTLDDYIKFFEALCSGRPDTSHFIRDAICDYLLPEDSPSITILGGRVSSKPHQRRMGVDGWDILYQYFSQDIAWCFLERYSVGYEDLVLVKKLAALHRYGSPGSGEPSWLHLDDDPAQECQTALFLGFVAQTKGFCDPRVPLAHAADGTVTEKQSRNYVVGRMSKSNPLAKKLIGELTSRVVRFIVYAYDREAHKRVAQNDDLDSTWITRTRMASDQADLANANWKSEWSVKDILNDMEFFRSFRDRMMDKDYYEIIIIDRTERLGFDLLECVADALMQLSGISSDKDAIVNAVRDIIPSAEQDDLLKAIVGDTLPFARLSESIPCLGYEGNRSRAWDTQRKHLDILANSKDRQRWDIREVGILSGILSSMEAAGVISKVAKYSRPHAIPKLLMAIDGHEDLYFDYSGLFGGKDNLAAQLGKVTPDKSKGFLHNTTLDLEGDGLRHFAEEFKAANPEAVFSKGTIHTHYCAWPLPHMEGISWFADLNFCTPHGHLYKWNHLPFDCPLSFEVWQFFLHCEVNCKLPFVRATQTTFVICAKTPGEVEGNIKKMQDVADKMGWKASIPMAHRWTGELELLDVEVLWRGIQPLAAHSP
ncbi:hypothetical protein BFJ63_vAg17785 [Fusarium oxysporum f. sp. narcissi]|uniref:Uncharacterized protein n=1 Tax=Fusarium oxysporum f. sp. narcissi TaxID=451672 RepID=A0A4Q2UYZ9_FUSOX|nr:hypothetical protein BFJ63_vAg17785 [Fusarium oxysporum f. sp. narcissi]